MELAGVLDTLEHWRRCAIISADPQEYRRMLRRAALLEVAPWSGSPYRKEKPDGSMRTLAVGNSGAVVYLILEQERAVRSA